MGIVILLYGLLEENNKYKYKVLVLGLNIFLPHALYRTLSFKNVSTNCAKTPETV
jgi:hypothetical protein